jgi:hypothetical protein
MRSIFTLIFLGFALSLPAQERVVSGQLKDESGYPLPGVNIAIKGTSRGTTTDAEGKYSIVAPIGATLVFSFVGMKSMEVVVGKKGQVLPPSSIPGSSDAFDKITIDKGSTTLSDHTHGYINHVSPYFEGVDDDVLYALGNKYPLNPYGIGSIRFISPRVAARRYQVPAPRGIYLLTPGDHFNFHRKLTLQFTTYFTGEVINKLPSLQSKYAQGEPMNGTPTWNGADQQEIFSWGPRMETLEYDGQTYPFDKHGGLVTSGNGNGVKARSYHPADFFRTGLASAYHIGVAIPLQQNSHLILSGSDQTKTGVIPRSRFAQRNAMMQFKQFRISDNLRLDASTAYTHGVGNLMQRGANLSSIMGSVLRTPSTFDNTNGYPSQGVLRHEDAYTLPDGSARSHAPAYVDNPYALVKAMPDREALTRWISSLQLYLYMYRKFNIQVSGNFDKQWNDLRTGLSPQSVLGEGGRLTQRNDRQSFFQTLLTPSYQVELYPMTIKASVSHQFTHTKRHLERMDAFVFSKEGYGNISEAFNRQQQFQSQQRTTHEILSNLSMNYNEWLVARVGTRTYFSNTVIKKSQNYWQPSANISVNIGNIIGVYPIDNFPVYVSYASALREAPLIYSNWSYNSLNVPVKDYAKYYESQEIVLSPALRPEVEQKFETGLSASMWSNAFQFEGLYYSQTTDNMILPASINNTYQFTNGAKTNTKGVQLVTSYHHYNKIHWSMSVSWSKYNAMVRKVYGAELIPLSGFSEVRSVMAAGKPVGAIYGTSYARNDRGVKIIDADGFPLKDGALKMIGNPNPDWLLSWKGFMQWKSLSLSCIVDMRKGGDRWNGTRAMLNYLGRGGETEEGRMVSGYLYDGVLENGLSNTHTVSFADPTLPLSSNRYVRYGWDGVGEDMIEKATSIRFQEIRLTVDLTRILIAHVPVNQVQFSCIVNNLLLYAPYRGVDPASTLFGYRLGAGLDLFNLPSTRSIGVQLTIKI